MAGCEPPDLVGRSRLSVLLVQVEVALVDVQPRDVDVTGQDPANPIRDKGNFFVSVPSRLWWPWLTSSFRLNAKTQGSLPVILVCPEARGNSLLKPCSTRRKTDMLGSYASECIRFISCIWQRMPSVIHLCMCVTKGMFEFTKSVRPPQQP